MTHFSGVMHTSSINPFMTAVVPKMPKCQYLTNQRNLYLREIRPHQVDCSSYGSFCKKILRQTPKKIKIKSGFQTLTVNVFGVKSDVYYNR